MTREELLRVLTFVDETRRLLEARAGLSAVDPRWNVISYAMRRHLEGKLLLITSMALAAGVPYGTARRRIDELIDEGLLLRRVRSRTGKSFSLHPTRKLIQEFEAFAARFKAQVGAAFGFSSEDTPEEDFFFGGYYMASRILSYPSAMRSGVGYDRKMRILGPVDPTFRTLDTLSSSLNELCGTEVELTILPLDELYREIISDGERPRSRYDLLAIDLPWVGQLSQAGLIRPLNDLIEEARYNASDFHSAAWNGSRYGGKQYGIPIQPTAELLFCRKDLLDEAGIAPPETTDQLLAAARRMHGWRPSVSGIVMNFARGTPVAHTFMQTLADFGQPVINLKALGDGFDLQDIRGDNFRPMVDTPAGREAADFLMELKACAHPESLVCDWDRRIGIFSRGQAAMSYGWSIRAAEFELKESSPAHGRVIFRPHPHRPGGQPVSPIGGFALALPSNLDQKRVRSAWKVMEYLTRPELLKWFVQNGNLTSPRFSTSADPEVQAMSRIIREVDVMERKGILQSWPRPSVPEFCDIAAILGDEIHFMLKGTLTVKDALARAQQRIDAVMRQNGRYGSRRRRADRRLPTAARP